MKELNHELQEMRNAFQEKEKTLKSKNVIEEESSYIQLYANDNAFSKETIKSAQEITSHIRI